MNLKYPTNKIKIAFFGTSDRSIPILETLHKNFDLFLCVTKTDVKYGRKQITKETSVKTWAKEKNINFFEIGTLNTITKENLGEQIIDSDIDLGIVADFSFILPKKILDAPKNGTMNIHFSLLPNYRGASPVQFTIKNGDEKAGVTYYLMDENMDTGDILYQFEYKLSGSETSDALYEILFEKAAQKLPKVINEYLQGTIKPKKQNNEVATYTFSPTHPKNTFIYKEDAKINWTDSPQQIEQNVRAYYAWPIAWTTLGEMQKYHSSIYNMSKLKGHINTELKVKVLKAEIFENKLKINELKVEGKNTLNWEKFKNGYLD